MGVNRELLRTPNREIIEIINSWQDPNDIPYDYESLIPLEMFYATIKALEVLSAFIVSNDGDVFWDVLNRQQIFQYDYEQMIQQYTELFTCQVFDDSGIDCELFDMVGATCEEFDFREFYNDIDLQEESLYVVRVRQDESRTDT